MRPASKAASGRVSGTSVKLGRGIWRELAARRERSVSGRSRRIDLADRRRDTAAAAVARWRRSRGWRTRLCRRVGRPFDGWRLVRRRGAGGLRRPLGPGRSSSLRPGRSSVSRSGRSSVLRPGRASPRSERVASASSGSSPRVAPLGPRTGAGARGSPSPGRPLTGCRSVAPAPSAAPCAARRYEPRPRARVPRRASRFAGLPQKRRRLLLLAAAPSRCDQRPGGEQRGEPSHVSPSDPAQERRGAACPPPVHARCRRPPRRFAPRPVATSLLSCPARWPGPTT